MQASDVENGTFVDIIVQSLPKFVQLRDSDGILIERPRSIPTAKIFANSSVCGEDAFEFKASDGELMSEVATFKLITLCPPKCEPRGSRISLPAFLWLVTLGAAVSLFL